MSVWLHGSKIPRRFYLQRCWSQFCIAINLLSPCNETPQQQLSDLLTAPWQTVSNAACVAIHTRSEVAEATRAILLLLLCVNYAQLGLTRVVRRLFVHWILIADSSHFNSPFRLSLQMNGQRCPTERSRAGRKAGPRRKRRQRRKTKRGNLLKPRSARR